MAKSKSAFGKIWQWVWECFKRSLLPLVMYITSSFVLVVFTFDQQKATDGLTTTRFWLCFGFGLFAVVYGAIMAFVEGGNGYDMLVAGNMKRRVEGEGLKMSKHKEEKEYRDWKGFAIGGFIALINLVVSLVWGANQEAINYVLTNPNGTLEGYSGIQALLSVNIFTWGWAVLPFVFANAGGVFVSYYWMALLGLLPIIACGITYIVGAYARRRKKLNQQEAEARAEEEAANRPKKINYGGLPGTKPNKKK